MVHYYVTSTMRRVIQVVCILVVLLSIIALGGQSGGKREHDAIKVLVRQAARWSTAAEQDESAMIAVLHANYGAGYLWALKDIATQQEIETVTGIDMSRFEREIVRVQDESTMRMARLCPQYAPASTYLTSIGGEGQ